MDINNIAVIIVLLVLLGGAAAAGGGGGNPFPPPTPQPDPCGASKLREMEIAKQLLKDRYPGRTLDQIPLLGKLAYIVAYGRCPGYYF